MRSVYSFEVCLHFKSRPGNRIAGIVYSPYLVLTESRKKKRPQMRGSWGRGFPSTGSRIVFLKLITIRISVVIECRHE